MTPIGECFLCPPNRIVAAAAGMAVLLMMLVNLGCEDRRGKIRFDKRSEFERIVVVDQDGRRYLRFGDSGFGYQSSISLDDPDAVAMDYVRLAMLGMMMPPRPQRVLMIGLGGGAFTSLVRRHYPDLWIDAVEIDPVVVEAAKRFFGVREDDRFRIHVADGAEFIRQRGTIYDLVFLDAYSAAGIPEALASREFFDAVAARLSEDGVVVANLWVQSSPEQTVADTFQAVFPNTACLRTRDDTNIVLFGAPGGIPDRRALTRQARAFTEASGLSFDLGGIAERLSLQCQGAQFSPGTASAR